MYIRSVILHKPAKRRILESCFDTAVSFPSQGFKGAHNFWAYAEFYKGLILHHSYSPRQRNESDIYSFSFIGLCSGKLSRTQTIKYSCTINTIKFIRPLAKEISIPNHKIIKLKFYKGVLNPSAAETIRLLHRTDEADVKVKNCSEAITISNGRGKNSSKLLLFNRILKTPKT